jgi:ribosomal protein S18 acetylase RimI-like enzyme
MADVICLHAKKDVEAFCRRNPFVHLYAIGDLDDFFWPHTTWVALRDGGEVRQLVLLYTDLTMRKPTVLAYAERPESLMGDLLRASLPVLPRRFYAHLTEGVADVLADDYRMQPHGTFHKMGLRDRSRAAAFDGSEAVPLSAADTEDLLALYAASYPGNWFVPPMLETGCYFGIRRGRALVSVAGVHVYSPQYKVAALGNITTRPDARGQGLATAVTARLSQELLQTGIEYVGLNVKADNHSAIACYKKLGFERVTDYGEYTVVNKEGARGQGSGVRSSPDP